MTKHVSRMCDQPPDLIGDVVSLFFWIGMASERDRISSTMGSEESLVRALLVCSGVIPLAPSDVL
jgi:hypothetical protein